MRPELLKPDFSGALTLSSGPFRTRRTAPEPTSCAPATWLSTGIRGRHATSGSTT